MQTLLMSVESCHCVSHPLEAFSAFQAFWFCRILLTNKLPLWTHWGLKETFSHKDTIGQRKPFFYLILNLSDIWTSLDSSYRVLRASWQVCGHIYLKLIKNKFRFWSLVPHGMFFHKSCKHQMIYLHIIYIPILNSVCLHIGWCFPL